MVVACNIHQRHNTRQTIMSRGKLPAPSHGKFQKNKQQANFTAKISVGKKAAASVGSGGPSHYASRPDPTNTASIPEARESLTGMSLDHHR